MAVLGVGLGLTQEFRKEKLLRDIRFSENAPTYVLGYFCDFGRAAGNAEIAF